MKKSIFNQALKIAKEKLPNHPEIDYFPHYTFIIQNKKIVSWATNKAKKPPIHFGYNKDDKTFLPKTHSEIEAYYKARKKLSKKPFSIINIRFTRNGELRISKPCNCCYRLLTCLGCKNFYYSHRNGFNVR